MRVRTDEGKVINDFSSLINIFVFDFPTDTAPKLSLLTKTFTDLFCQSGLVIQWWRRWFLWCSSNLRRIHFESKLTDGLSLFGFSLNRNVSVKGEDTHMHCIFVECVLTNIHQEMYGYIRVRTSERMKCVKWISSLWNIFVHIADFFGKISCEVSGDVGKLQLNSFHKGRRTSSYTVSLTFVKRPLSTNKSICSWRHSWIVLVY